MTTAFVTRKELSRWRLEALLGFIILLIGVGIAVNNNSLSISSSKSHGETTRAVLCTVFKEQDEQGVKQLPLSAKLLHIDLSTLEKYETENLKRQANYRKKLGPSNPKSACASGPVSLHPENDAARPPILPVVK